MTAYCYLRIRPSTIICPPQAIPLNHLSPLLLSNCLYYFIATHYFTTRSKSRHPPLCSFNLFLEMIGLPHSFRTLILDPLYPLRCIFCMCYNLRRTSSSLANWCHYSRSCIYLANLFSMVIIDAPSKFHDTYLVELSCGCSCSQLYS